MHILEDFDSSFGELFDDIAGLGHLATDRLLLTDNESLKRWTRQHPHHAHEPWALFKFSPREFVVGKHMGITDSPPHFLRIGFCILDLALDRLFLIRDLLLGGFSRVDGCGNHDVCSLFSAGTNSTSLTSLFNFCISASVFSPVAKATKPSVNSS